MYFSSFKYLVKNFVFMNPEIETKHLQAADITLKYFI